jgi:hypothetical protein
MDDLVANLTRCEEAQKDIEFWGPNWSSTKRFENNLLKKAMQEFTPWTFELHGNIMHVITNDTFPGVVKMHNIIGPTCSVSDQAYLAIKAYEQDVRQPRQI